MYQFYQGFILKKNFAMVLRNWAFGKVPLDVKDILKTNQSFLSQQILTSWKIVPLEVQVTPVVVRFFAYK